MSAVQFFLPYQTVTLNGVARAGATLTFYLTGTTTKTPIYETSALTTPLANPLTSNGAARFADIYLDSAITYRMVIKDRDGTILDDIDPVLPGTTIDLAQLLASISSIANATAHAATRNALAALNSANGPAYLTESGRDGMFVWDSSNLSTQVTADPNRAIYVPPLSAPTGTSGAWVRQFTGPAESLWWGVSTAATATANAAAFNAALATLETLAVTGFGYNDGSIGLHTPAGHYTFDDELVPEHAVEISGDYTGSGGGTVFEWTAAVHGFTVRGYDGADKHANGTTIRNLYLKGTGTGADKHAINQTGNLRVFDVFCDRWSGDAIHGVGDSPSGISGSKYRNVGAQYCGWTININGADSNGCTGWDISGSTNRFGCIFDGSGIGNAWFGGIVGGIDQTGTYPTHCESSGHIYMAGYGQETWCSTNAPSGTTDSNQGWWYLFDSTAQPYQPTWTTGQTWYFGSPLVAQPDDNNNKTLFCGFYIEGGNNAIVMNDPSLVVGGQIDAKVFNQFGTKHGGYIYADRYYASFNNGIKAHGEIHVEAVGSGYYVNTVKVVGDRDTGWTADTGGGKKTSNATYTGGTANATYNQSEITTIRNSLQDVSETVASLKNALIAHGLIG